MLQNAYFVAKIGADTAENEQHFAEICQKLATTLRVRRTGPRTSLARSARLRSASLSGALSAARFTAFQGFFRSVLHGEGKQANPQTCEVCGPVVIANLSEGYAFVEHTLGSFRFAYCW